MNNCAAIHQKSKIRWQRAPFCTALMTPENRRYRLWKVLRWGSCPSRSSSLKGSQTDHVVSEKTDCIMLIINSYAARSVIQGLTDPGPVLMLARVMLTVRTDMLSVISDRQRRDGQDGRSRELRTSEAENFDNCNEESAASGYRSTSVPIVMLSIGRVSVTWPSSALAVVSFS